MDNELKPCPFCGGEATRVNNLIPKEWHVVCLECDASTGFCETEQGAVTTWNRREVPAYKAGYKDGYQIGKSEVCTCKNIGEPKGSFLCSECSWGDFAPAGLPLKDANYCPNCGAKVVE